MVPPMAYHGRAPRHLMVWDRISWHAVGDAVACHHSGTMATPAATATALHGKPTECHGNLLLFAGAVQRTTNEQLTRRVMFGTIAGGENPGPGRPGNNRAQCLADDLRVFQATAESSPLPFGAETVLWLRAAEKRGKWYRGFVEAADCFMARWHMD